MKRKDLSTILMFSMTAALFLATFPNPVAFVITSISDDMPWGLQNVYICPRRFMNDQALASLCRSENTSLVLLTARRCRKPTKLGMYDIAWYCPTLRALDLSHSSIGDSGISTILQTTAKSSVSSALHACSSMTRRGIYAITFARPLELGLWILAVCTMLMTSLLLSWFPTSVYRFFAYPRDISSTSLTSGNRSPSRRRHSKQPSKLLLQG